MNAREYKPGDKVIIWNDGKPVKAGTVATVKQQIGDVARAIRKATQG